jgi:hypothetical protein
MICSTHPAFILFYFKGGAVEGWERVPWGKLEAGSRNDMLGRLRDYGDAALTIMRNLKLDNEVATEAAQLHVSICLLHCLDIRPGAVKHCTWRFFPFSMQHESSGFFYGHS